MDTELQSSPDFSISEGGPIYKALVRTNLYKNPGKLVLVVLCIVWLPLVMITAFEGTLYNYNGVGFLKDVAIQARLLVALPILIMMRLNIDNKVTAVLKYISEALMDAEERKLMLSTTYRRAKILTNSVWTEVIILFVVISITLSFVKSGMYSELHSGILSWMAETKEGNQSLSLAGDWAVFISLPVFQIFLFRWLWRYFIWVILLFRLSRARLNLRVTHPDHAGGLGIILQAQKNFILLFVAGGTLVSGELIVSLMKNPDSFNMVRNEILGYIIFSLVLVLIPLIFYAGKLIRIKHQGLFHLSDLGTLMSSQFENDWVNEKPIEQRISEKLVDPSMMYDFTGLYDFLQQLRPIPVTIRDILSMAVILVIPFIPILFIHFSVMELLQKILKLLV